MRKILYSKYSNDRDDKYAIRTSIVRDELGNRYIQKSFLTEAGREHFDNMKQAYQRLQELYQEQGGRLNVYTEIENGLEFEYINGNTLEFVLHELLVENKIEEARKLLGRYFSFVESIAGNQRFTLTKEFQQVFGLPEIDFSQEKAASVVDVDLILPNIIINDTWNIIDYEWTFFFPIPMKFVIYRGMLYWFLENTNQLPIGWNEVMELAGITVEMEDQFKLMEEHFQKYIAGTRVSAAKMRDLIDQEIISINPINVEQAERSNIQIFYDRGEGFSEKDSILKKRKWSDHNKISLFLETNDTIKAIRLDPEEKECMIVVKKIASGGQELDYQYNGEKLTEGVILFLTEDVKFLIPHTDTLSQGIEIEMEVYLLNDTIKNLLTIPKHRIEELQNQILTLQNEKQDLIAERDHMKQQSEIAFAAYEETQNQMIKKMFFSRALYILKREGKKKTAAIRNKFGKRRQ